MFRRMKFALVGLLLSVSAACGSSTTAGTASPTPSTSPSPVVSATPVSYDPCVLVTAQEASTLTGMNFGPGKEDLAGATKLCVYGYQTTDVFSIGIVQAPDLATIQTDEAKAKAALQATAGSALVSTDLQGVGDAATVIQASKTLNGTNLSLCGIYVVKGTIFFFITDVAVNHAVPNNAALQGEATTVLGRL
jgi:hypothetical protein